MTDKRVEAQQVIRETEHGGVSDHGSDETRSKRPIEPPPCPNPKQSPGVAIDEKVLLRELKEELSTICDMYRSARDAKEENRGGDGRDDYFPDLVRFAIEISTMYLKSDDGMPVSFVDICVQILQLAINTRGGLA